MARVKYVEDKTVFVFVGDASVYHFEWLESVSHTDWHERDVLDFYDKAGYEQFVRYPTHIAGSRLDLVMATVYMLRLLFTVYMLRA